MFASTIVQKTRENPTEIAVRGGLPVRISSLIRSKMRTFASTPIPIVRMTPAIPGRVRVAAKYAIAPIRMSRFSTRAMTALIPDSR